MLLLHFVDLGYGLHNYYDFVGLNRLTLMLSNSGYDDFHFFHFMSVTHYSSYVSTVAEMG